MAGRGLMLLEATQSVLQKQGWQFYDLGDATLRIDVQGPTANWMILVQCIEESEQLIAYSICANKPPTSRYGAVQEFLTRANFGLRIGNFEFDLEDGEIRFKTSIAFAGTVSVEPMIEKSLLLNIMTMQQYLDGILQVMFSDIAPLEAIARIESSSALSEPSQPASGNA